MGLGEHFGERTMGEPARRRATYEDLLQVPDNMIAEILDGELYAAPRPASPHAFTASNLGTDILGAFGRKRRPPDNPGGWWILFEPEIHLDEDIVVPDLAGWRRERMPRVPNVAYFTAVPDWVCEVLSPSTVRVDRTTKLRVYAGHEVPYLWIVDPLHNTLEAYRLEGQNWLLLSSHAGTGKARVVPFEEIELDLSGLWLDLEEE